MPEFIIESEAAFRRWTFEDSEITIGRDESCDIHLDDHQVSRQHAKVGKGASGWFIKDLGSGNGTFMGGERVVKASLGRGAVVNIGSVRLTFLLDEDDPAEEEVMGVEGAPAVDGWEPVEFLGEGPLSCCFSYRRLPGEKMKAFRVVRPQWVQREGVCEWLEKGVAAWNAVDHPGLVRLELLRGDSGELILAERLAEGGTLRSLLSAESRLPQHQSLDIAVRLARMIVELHESDVTHLGIRPEQVRFDKDGGFRLSGPGLLQKLIPDISGAQARSLACVAPEGFLEEGTMGRRSDIYSFGCVLHEMILGGPVAEGRSLEAVKNSAINGIRRTPDERRKGLVEGFSGLLEAILEVDPADRPKDMSELLGPLEALREVAGVRPKGDPKQMRGRERDVGERQEAPRKSVRFRVLSWCVTIFVFLLLNTLLFLLIF